MKEPRSGPEHSPRTHSGYPCGCFVLGYKAVGKIGEGTFSEVTKMQSLRDGGYYACKQMKQRFER